MNQTLKIEWAFHVQKQARGRKKVAAGDAPQPVCERGRVPRVSRLLALAIRFERLVREGVVENYATLARLGGVTRARVCQVVALLNLASDIQEQVLHLPRVQRGRDPLRLRDLLPIAMIWDWKIQRRMWQQLNSHLRTEPSS